MSGTGSSCDSPKFWLEIVGGPQVGAAFPLREGDLVVGRSPRCFITLGDARVAPTHCGLRVRPNQVIIAPGGTVVATVVNGERLGQARLLRVGDEIAIGPYRLRLRARLDEHERRLNAGDQVGPFRVRAELGYGGVGRVYEALDAQGRAVALKILRIRDNWPAKQIKHRRALFRREAAALAAIDHPHVVRSLGAGEQDDLPWLAMELLEGPTLREELSAGRLPVSEIERIMFQLCSAVAAVHEAGVIHRDLKPSNVLLVGPERRACLADFGLAQPREAPRLDELDPTDDPGIVRVGRQVGTPAYMPPEQTRGEEADMRSDVWSLGAMLYELAAGRRPFARPKDDVRAVLTAVVNDCPAELPDDVEPHLRAVVYRCLQKHRAWRFRDAVDLVEALHDRRVVQALPCGIEGPPRIPLQACPHCGAPIEHPLECPRCKGRIFRYTDGQVLAVPTPDGGTILACGACAAVVTSTTERCPVCQTAFTDVPPQGQTRSAVRLSTGGTAVIDIYDRALELLDQCPYCSAPREGEPLACPSCGFNLRGYVCGRVTLELALGGWSIQCAHCGCGIEEPDEVYCPDCGLSFASGQFHDGTRFQDEVPAHLLRRLEEPDG